MPEWITVRTPEEGGQIATSRAPFDPPTTQALVKAARSVQPEPPATPPKSLFWVYVALLRYANGEHGLYVGLTGLTPDRRYLNHKAGHKASKSVLRHGIGLLPALYKHLGPLGRSAAESTEVELAEALRATGTEVRQG
ncbi:MAG TPA: hypothetical protein VGK16_07365 [Candidatus Limnocylindrales bacterium]|jgi:hypothetical protein